MITDKIHTRKKLSIKCKEKKKGEKDSHHIHNQLSCSLLICETITTIIKDKREKDENLLNNIRVGVSRKREAKKLTRWLKKMKRIELYFAGGVDNNKARKRIWDMVRKYKGFVIWK